MYMEGMQGWWVVRVPLGGQRAEGRIRIGCGASLGRRREVRMRRAVWRRCKV